MSLVAYAASSDEDSDSEENEDPQIPPTDHSKISDEEDYYSTNEAKSIISRKPEKSKLYLPAPSKEFNDYKSDETDTITASLLKLPTPKTLPRLQTNIIEEDDEFLHKKSINTSTEKPPPPITIKGPVKITIPSLSQFRHLEDKEKKIKPQPQPEKGCGLLNILPKPKNEQFFTSKTSSMTESTSRASVTSLIPDSVKNRQVKNKSNTKKKSSEPKIGLVDFSDSDKDDNDDDSDADFFSLNTNHDLPEVSITEINAMVAQRAAKMAKAKIQAHNEIETNDGIELEQINDTAQRCAEGKETVRFDENAIQALVGRQAKRRKLADNVQVVELSSAQVLPNKDEWLRSALASETTYQAQGVLVDEEPAPGTRKKHQITYLAHQAKANEAELQAMWAANRQTRRATASKYGF